MIPMVLEYALGYNIHRVGLLLRREVMKALADYQMTPAQMQIMRTLWSSRKPISQSEIAHITLNDRHTLSRIIKRLERDGWIKKLGNEKDGRLTMIEATKKSEALLNELPQRLSAHFATIWKALGKEEQQTLLESCKKLREAMGDY